MINKWHCVFKRVRESLEDNPRLERPNEVTSPEILEKVEKFIMEDSLLKNTSIFLILHDHLGMTKVDHSESNSQQDSMQWHKKVTLPLKKFNMSQSAGKPIPLRNSLALGIASIPLYFYCYLF
ncbi:unnamed protein product [Euphydryas editha]|uniref:Uncharacterized protein n=1 Tax=Euphydryas editha TaxID=104508 RepID=A0AAU9UEZ1_EUPED|nr:unnamed protein product [Euphydryas editha]